MNQQIHYLTHPAGPYGRVQSQKVGACESGSDGQP